jgi:hypothetical protein
MFLIFEAIEQRRPNKQVGVKRKLNKNYRTCLFKVSQPKDDVICIKPRSNLYGEYCVILTTDVNEG